MKVKNEWLSASIRLYQMNVKVGPGQRRPDLQSVQSSIYKIVCLSRRQHLSCVWTKEQK